MFTKALQLSRGIALVCLLFLVACASPTHTPLRPVTPVPTATPHPIRLPADDAPHNDLTEWWYYTGHLSGANDAQYGFEIVIFQIERVDVPVFYAAHVAITDHQRREFHYDEKVWTRDRVPAEFALGDSGWQIGGDGTADMLKASAAGYGLDLRVTPTKPPALHGTDGVISFGPVGDSYYYSSTRMTIEGTIDDHGVKTPVTGEAWKDRQWGNFLVTPGGGWDWYSLQLTDGSDLMLFVLRDVLGQASPSYGTLVHPDGTTETLTPGMTQAKAIGSWTSPATGTMYPSGWQVDVPERGLQLTLHPVVPNQELDTRKSTGQIYWEGEVTIEGLSGGKAIAGKGYVELTGYAAAKSRP